MQFRRNLWWLIGGVVLGLVVLGWLMFPAPQAAGVTGSSAQHAPALAASPAQPLRLLVIGGTSGIGLEAVKLALSRGHFVTCMARRAPAAPLSSEHLRFLQGDVADAAAVNRAVMNQDAVITSVSIGPTQSAVSVFSVGGRNVLAAMKSAGVPRLIAVTGIGAGDSRGHGGFGYNHIFQPLLLRTIYDDKNREEEAIRTSSVDWTIVRPAFLTNGPAQLQYWVVADLAGVRSGSISRADVAHFIVAAVESDLHTRQAVMLSN